nr:uncharacterized protein LOC106837588 [Equus asinus]
MLGGGQQGGVAVSMETWEPPQARGWGRMGSQEGLGGSPPSSGRAKKLPPRAHAGGQAGRRPGCRATGRKAPITPCPSAAPASQLTATLLGGAGVQEAQEAGGRGMGPAPETRWELAQPLSSDPVTAPRLLGRHLKGAGGMSPRLGSFPVSRTPASRGCWHGGKGPTRQITAPRLGAWPWGFLEGKSTHLHQVPQPQETTALEARELQKIPARGWRAELREGARETRVGRKRPICHLVPERQHQEGVTDQCKGSEWPLEAPAWAPSPFSTHGAVPCARSTLGSLLHKRREDDGGERGRRGWGPGRRETEERRREGEGVGV